MKAESLLYFTCDSVFIAHLIVKFSVCPIDEWNLIGYYKEMIIYKWL